jgi:hypothetical protein
LFVLAIDLYSGRRRNYWGEMFLSLPLAFFSDVRIRIAIETNSREGIFGLPKSEIDFGSFIG